VKKFNTQKFMSSILVLFSKYNYNDQLKEVEMARVCSTNGGEKERILVGKPEGRPRRREIDNIKMNLREIR
jgi:hypothetical protein